MKTFFETSTVLHWISSHKIKDREESVKVTCHSYLISTPKNSEIPRSVTSSPYGTIFPARFIPVFNKWRRIKFQ